MYYVNLTGEVQYNQEPEEKEEENPNASQSFIYNSNDPSQFQIPGSPPGQFVGELFYATPKVSKIMDGFFVGAQDAGVDMEFMLSNKVMGVVNCAAHIIPNSLLRYDVKYLPFRWEDRKNTIMFDPRGRDLSRIVKFIDRIRIKGGAVLITSVNGTSRAIYATLAYFVHKFDWSILKALEYIQSKRVGILLKPVFLKQLAVAALTLKGAPKTEKSLLDMEGSLETFKSRWMRNCKSTLETVLQNTFVNSHPEPDEEALLRGDKEPSTRRLSWWDGTPLTTMPEGEEFKRAVAERKERDKRGREAKSEAAERKHHNVAFELKTDETSTQGRSSGHTGPSEHFRQELAARPHTPATPAVSPSKAAARSQASSEPKMEPGMFDQLDSERRENLNGRAAAAREEEEEDVLLESLEDSYDESAEIARAAAKAINQAVASPAINGNDNDNNHLSRVTPTSPSASPPTASSSSHKSGRNNNGFQIMDPSDILHSDSNEADSAAVPSQFKMRSAQMSFSVPKHGKLGDILMRESPTMLSHSSSSPLLEMDHSNSASPQVEARSLKQFAQPALQQPPQQVEPKPLLYNNNNNNSSKSSSSSFSNPNMYRRGSLDDGREVRSSRLVYNNASSRQQPQQQQQPQQRSVSRSGLRSTMRKRNGAPSMLSRGPSSSSSSTSGGSDFLSSFTSGSFSYGKNRQQQRPASAGNLLSSGSNRNSLRNGGVSASSMRAANRQQQEVELSTPPPFYVKLSAKKADPPVASAWSDVSSSKQAFRIYGGRPSSGKRPNTGGAPRRHASASSFGSKDRYARAQNNMSGLPASFTLNSSLRGSGLRSSSANKSSYTSMRKKR